MLPSEKALRRRVGCAIAAAYLTSLPHAALCFAAVLLVTALQVLVTGLGEALWLLLGNLMLVHAIVFSGIAVIVCVTPRRKHQTLWGVQGPRGVAGLICRESGVPGEVRLTTLGAWPRRGSRAGQRVAVAAAQHYISHGKTVVFSATRWLAPVYERHGYVRVRPVLFGLVWTMRSV